MEIRIEESTVSSMVEAIYLLIDCVDSLKNQLLQYESIEEIEEWLPEINRVEDFREDYGYPTQPDKMT